MKKLIAIFLVFSLMLTVAACSKKKDTLDNQNPVIVNPSNPDQPDPNQEKPVEDPKNDPVVVGPVTPVLIKPSDSSKLVTDANGDVYKVITRWVNGTYSTSETIADSHGYKAKISITLVDGKITSVFFDEISKTGTSKREDATYNAGFKNLYGFTIADAISILEKRLVARQNPANVDTLSSATITSNRFISLAVKTLQSVPVETIRVLVSSAQPAPVNPDEDDDDLDLIIEQPGDDVVTSPTGDGDWEEETPVNPPVEEPKEPIDQPQDPIINGTKLVAYGQPYKVRVVGATDSRGYFPLLEVSVNGSGNITSVYYDEAKADETLKSANPNYYPTFVAANNMTMGDLYKIYEEHFKNTGSTEGIDVTTGATNVHTNFLALATKAMKLEPATRLTVYGNSASSYTPFMTVTIGTDGKIQNVLYDEIHDVNGSSKVENLNSSTPYFSQLLTRAFIKLDEIFKIYEFKFMHQTNLESVDTVTNATRSINAFTLLSNQVSRMISLTPSINVAAKLPAYGDPYTIKAVGTTLQGWTPYLIVNVAKDGTIRTVEYDEVDQLGMKKSDTLTTGNVAPTVYSGYRLAFNYYADYFKRFGTLSGIENHTTVNSISGLHANFSALVQQVLTPSSNVEITLTKDVASTTWRPELKIIVNEDGVLTYAFFNEYREGRLSKVEDPNYYPAMKDKNPEGYTIQQVFAIYDAYLVANGNVDDIDTVSGATSFHNTYTGFVSQLKEMILNRIITASIPESTEPEVVAIEPEESIEDPS